MKLTEIEWAALDAVVQQPGITSNEVGERVPVSLMSVSEVMTKLTKSGVVNRVRPPRSQNYLYYPLGAELPEGYSTWDNTIIGARS